MLNMHTSSAHDLLRIVRLVSLNHLVDFTNVGIPRFVKTLTFWVYNSDLLDTAQWQKKSPFHEVYEAVGGSDQDITAFS